MVDFRRWILALAVLALFTGLASAQVGTGVGNNPQFTCATNVSAVPQLRAEGITEVTGDIVITCTGGNPVTLGTQIPTVNISVFLNTNITSRLLGQTGVANASEALLMIDEPGSTSPTVVPGFGPGAPQSVCPTPGSGCPEFATNLGAEPGFPAGFTVATNAPGAVPAGANPGATEGFNVFQGVVNPDGIHPNLVTFFGIPVLPPASTGTSRVFRITNIRANASVFGGAVATTQQVIAQIAVSNPAALPITNSTPVVGLVQHGLNTSLGGAPFAGRQCVTTTKTVISTINFSEGFATAFKTRVAAQANVAAGAGQTVPTNQNVPGAIYNSESNFVLPVGGLGGTAGLADFGTRLKATFHNLPTSVSLFVSVNNVINSTTAAPVPALIGGSAANGLTPGFAELVSGETVADGSTVPTVASSTTINGIPVAQISPDSSGNATAVWEVVNTNPASLDTFTFAVFTTFTGNAVPAPTSVTANLSFAPTPPATPLVVIASAGSPIPRFVDLSAAPGSAVLNISICRTVLLYPFVTNQAGFDTGIAIANTSTDPFATGPQAGSCTLNWFSAGTAPPIVTTPNIPSGTVFTTLASLPGVAQGFQGYMIAVCNFQYAHGFAFISDLGAQKLAEGYLALVIPDPSSGRNADPLSTAPAASGENIAH